MNERIKELWSQAGGHYNKGNQHTWPQYTIDNPENFAELIVRECCQKLEDDGMVEVAIEMKQHFGLEGMSTEDKKTLIKELLGVKND